MQAIERGVCLILILSTCDTAQPLEAIVKPSEEAFNSVSGSAVCSLIEAVKAVSFPTVGLLLPLRICLMAVMLELALFLWEMSR